MGFVLTGSTVVICPHGAPVRNVTNKGNTHLIDGHPIWVSHDLFEVTGCPIPKFSCREVSWHNASMTMFLNGSAVLTSDSIATCRYSGTATIVSHQMGLTDKS